MDLEVEEVSTKEAFQKEKKKLLPSSVRFFSTFLFASLLMMVIRGNYTNAIDYIGPPVISFFIYYFVHYARLRRSYREMEKGVNTKYSIHFDGGSVNLLNLVKEGFRWL